MSGFSVNSYYIRVGSFLSVTWLYLEYLLARPILMIVFIIAYLTFMMFRDESSCSIFITTFFDVAFY